MNRSKSYFLVLALVIGSIAFVTIDRAAATSHEGIKAEIAAVAAEWAKQFNAGNAAGITALYTEDAKVLPPNSDFVTGKEGITGIWQGMFDAGAKGATLNTVEVTGMGDHAAEVGTFEVLDAEGKVIDKGKFIVLWKKVGSAWKLHRDIWNSSMPAPPESPTKVN